MSDGRREEIIEADVYMYHNVMDLQRVWYFAQVGHDHSSVTPAGYGTGSFTRPG